MIVSLNCLGCEVKMMLTPDRVQALTHFPFPSPTKLFNFRAGCEILMKIFEPSSHRERTNQVHKPALTLGCHGSLHLINKLHISLQRAASEVPALFSA